MGSAYPANVAERLPATGGWSQAPTNGQPKHVSFELLLQEHRARLPMRVNIYPHDTTESIVATVKNFHGIYESQGQGVSFEDRNGNTLIARYENFEHNMTVYVRVITVDRPQPCFDDITPRPSMSPRKGQLDEPFEMLPPHHARPSSRAARKRSTSPQNSHGRRSASTSTNPKSRGRQGRKWEYATMNPYPEGTHADYSDSECGEGSVTSSRRENLASAEISLDNILEGGRRKRAKFDSSELPLFAPPQVPMTASMSSVSPQRRISSNNGASPFTYGNQQTFSYTQPLPSPQSYGQSEVSYAQGYQMNSPYAFSNGQPHGHRLRTRGPAQGAQPRQSINGILPTPDPTIGGSVISDEDVALQLMRLGDASNFSHGRTSTSTLDDALSGKAELASSDEESDDGSEVDDLPRYAGDVPAVGRLPDNELPRSFDSGESSGEDYEDGRDGSFQGESDEVMADENGNVMHKPNQPNSRSGSSAPKSVGKMGKPRAPLQKSKSKTSSNAKAPISPTSLPSASRKTSSASLTMQQFGADEEDLSTKPRCQRCRKSKKGCDRQRPCQRCKDAGIGAEGCVSEDEGNGRKGRYGRHMGVPVKKDSMTDVTAQYNATAPIASTMSASPVASVADKNKKRKR
ncbi:hypothetical protein K490DRAFT_42375 [Saccharata proteae CBS 121410]|uniref:Zn(2)-C6 fungal-type domain-containing protein n=1 Tax=Saccharata proteae CBS 121410 TaxID=1314787 RepID=A0A9P4HVD8_9PEZI|nr:hypothetical protein K490DRAFT_42375 [Saccharata proteae CBS 121410]